MKHRGSDIRSFFSSAKRPDADQHEEQSPTDSPVTSSPSNLPVPSTSAASVKSSMFLFLVSLQLILGSNNLLDMSAAAEPESSAPVPSLDIGDYVHLSGTRLLSDDIKLRLIRSRKPGASVEMPAQVVSDKSRKGGKRMRYCNRSWFDTFPFTAFSPSKHLFAMRILPCFAGN